ncbi:MAG: chemotaxis protein CheW [Hylemonella sp.]|uniref:chemotaxis protein CheW n=1 Tax=Hylemonella sp. TaxID=2066020 RepID=UPI0039191DA0
MPAPATRLQTDTYLPYMRDVSRCEQSLRELNQMWRMIESSAKMNCPQEAQTILPIMAATRDGFSRLEQELVDSLVGEKVANVLAAVGTKAQYVIDIVVRNLYERTADVGFLATDRELCTFVAGLSEDVDAIRSRLLAYRHKYTVYNEIMLLDARGNVLVQLDPESPVEGSVDPLIAQTLASDSFVETFRATDLRPGRTQALIYSRRMHHPQTGAVVGLLCLCFDFEAEMAGIFRSHRDPEGRANMLLLDENHRVIASADERWIAPGTTVPVNPEGRPQLMIHEGREYLVRTTRAEGYQGYLGPEGWLGQVMTPVDLAFSGDTRQTLTTLDPAVASGLLAHARHFSPPLFEVMTATETIRRVVWNGQVITADRSGERVKLKTILDQISETGARSNALFSQSIRDLYETVLESKQRNTEFVAQLLVDLLDRNLYERADDCRWWALTPELRQALAAPDVPETEARRVQDILAYIHSLYTVYTQLFVYDREGRIIARSCRGSEPGPAQIDAGTLERVRALGDDQAYHVSAFEPSALYGGQPTYIYHAAVRHPDHERQVVGGIGIVFDSAREFQAMLHGSLSQDSGISAYFVNRDGRIISSTAGARPVGGALALEPQLRQLPRGRSVSRIVEHEGQYAVMGCAASQGYREFKVSDGYEEDVLAVVYLPLGAVRQDRGLQPAESLAIEDEGYAADGQERQTYATFQCGGGLLALPAVQVLEALPLSALSARIPGGPQGRVGMLAPQNNSQIRHFVWVFDLGWLLLGRPSTQDANSQIVIVRHGLHTVGLLVDALHAVPEFAEAQRMPSPFGTGHKLVSHFIKANGGQLLIQLLDPAALFERLAGGLLTATEAELDTAEAGKEEVLGK